MSLYLDASVLVPLFVAEARSNEAQAALQGQPLFISDLAAVEFSAAVSRRVRIGDLSADDADSLYLTFDAWVAKAADRACIETGDMATTLALVRRLDLHLRMADAANLAIAQRLEARLYTFDRKMAAAAAAIGLDVQG